MIAFSFSGQGDTLWNEKNMGSNERKRSGLSINIDFGKESKSPHIDILRIDYVFGKFNK